MSGLTIRLAAGDNLVVNGAAIQFLSDGRVRLANRARFLFGRQIMPPDQANSPARRIYFALQVAHVGEEAERVAALAALRDFIDDFARVTTSETARRLLAEAWTFAESGDTFRALRIARRILRHEAAVLDGTVSTQSMEPHPTGPPP